MAEVISVILQGVNFNLKVKLLMEGFPLITFFLGDQNFMMSII